MSKCSYYFTVISLCFCIIFIIPPSLHASLEQIKPIIQNIENELNATIGVAVYDTQIDSMWSYNGGKRIPLMSTAKVLVCANLLAEMDAKRSNLEKQILITKDQIVTYSPVLEKYINKRLALKDICFAAMSMSDNTAINIVLEELGGVAKVTEFMRSIGDSVTRLDRNEPTLNEALLGDERDTTTPKAMVNSLNTILFGDVLSNASRKQLLEWMKANKVAGALTRSVLPQGWKIADRSGAGGFGSRGIVAVLWPPNHEPIIISIYVKQTDATIEERNHAIIRISEGIIKIWGIAKLQ